MERSLASRIGSVFIAFVMVFTCCGIPTETISAWADEAVDNGAPIEQETAGTQEPEATDPVIPKTRKRSATPAISPRMQPASRFAP